MGDSNSPVLTETRRSKGLLNRIILHHRTSIDPLQEASRGQMWIFRSSRADSAARFPGRTFQIPQLRPPNATLRGCWSAHMGVKKNSCAARILKVCSRETNGSVTQI